jgi:hypothetical protein
MIRVQMSTEKYGGFAPYLDDLHNDPCDLLVTYQIEEKLWTIDRGMPCLDSLREP